MTETSNLSLLPEAIRLAFEKKGYDALTKVQSAVLSPEHAGHNLRISSQTGSGKTVALGLAIAADLIEYAQDPSHNDGPRALVIAPTRELAQQVEGELAWLFSEIRGITTDVVTGGTEVRGEQRRIKRNPPTILVATPGRLLDHIRGRVLDCSNIHNVVLDEADEMLDMGFRDDLEAIVAALPEERRSHLVSATFHGNVLALARKFQGTDARSVEGTQLGVANEDIEHIAYIIRPHQRYGALVNLLLQQFGKRVLIFVQKRSESQDLAEALAGDGFSALPFSGDLSQAQRNRTLSAFRNGVVQVLVCTDVAARGIDVPDIAVVVHMSMPMNSEVYTHRSGRTGRAGRKGASLSLIVPGFERRVRRMFSDAKIKAQFNPVPSAASLEQAAKEYSRNKLAELFETETEFSADELSYSSEIIEKHGAETVVAALLRKSMPALPREPFDIDKVSARAEDPRGGDGRGDSRGRDRDSRGNRDRDRDEAPRRPRDDSNMVTFEISWGNYDGATPAKIVSHLCRRANVSSRDLGAINIMGQQRYVDVSGDVAAQFESLTSQPDPTDPNVHVRRSNGSQGGARGAKPSFGGGGGRGGGRGPRAGGSRGGPPRDGDRSNSRPPRDSFPPRDGERSNSRPPFPPRDSFPPQRESFPPRSAAPAKRSPGADAAPRRGARFSDTAPASNAPSFFSEGAARAPRAPRAATHQGDVPPKKNKRRFS